MNNQMARMERMNSLKRDKPERSVVEWEITFSSPCVTATLQHDM